MYLHLIISGRVQGVGYRQWFCRRAREAELAGWVRNRFDGTVEAMVAGPAEAVEALITEAKAGPPGAYVGTIERHIPAEPLVVDEGEGFAIRPSV